MISLLHLEATEREGEAVVKKGKGKAQRRRGEGGSSARVGSSEELGKPGQQRVSGPPATGANHPPPPPPPSPEPPHTSEGGGREGSGRQGRAGQGGVLFVPWLALEFSRLVRRERTLAFADSSSLGDLDTSHHALPFYLVPTMTRRYPFLSSPLLSSLPSFDQSGYASS